MGIDADTTIEISHKGDVRQPAIELATEKVSHVAETCRERVGHVEIRLTLEPNPARERPAIAEATLDVDGQPVRAHVAAGTVEESVDLLTDRLRRRLRRHEDRRHRLPERHRTGDSGPGEWRHGDMPVANPEYAVIPFDEREVRRHKTFALDPISVEEAMFDLDQLGHEFYLFVDAETGADSVIRHVTGGTYQLLALEPNPAASELDDVEQLTASPPVLSLTDAKEHLEALGDDHLFFQDDTQQRGRVLYRRYDGHYGLVTPG